MLIYKKNLKQFVHPLKIDKTNFTLYEPKKSRFININNNNFEGLIVQMKCYNDIFYVPFVFQDLCLQSLSIKSSDDKKQYKNIISDNNIMYNELVDHHIYFNTENILLKPYCYINIDEINIYTSKYILTYLPKVNTENNILGIVISDLNKKYLIPIQLIDESIISRDLSLTIQNTQRVNNKTKKIKYYVVMFLIFIIIWCD